MNVFEVSYMKRKNLGNYEHEEVTLKAQIDEGEDFMDCTARLKFSCSQALSMVVQAEQPKETVKEEVKEPAPKKATKKTKKVTKKVAPKKEETTPLTLQEVKTALAGVWKAKSKDVALEILGKFDAKRSDELKEDQFSAVMEECEKAMK